MRSWLRKWGLVCVAARWENVGVVVLHEPGVDRLDEVAGQLGAMQHDGLPVQLHPGDVGWQWRFGAETTATAIRTWSRQGQTLAVGMLDTPRLLRLAVAREAAEDEELAHRIVLDVTRPERGVLPRGDVCVEARFGNLLRQLLSDAGWVADEVWTPLRRDLTHVVEDCNMSIEVIGAEHARVRAAIQRAAFDNSAFTEARWREMAVGPLYAQARCLVAYDGQGTAVAAATVWSAGMGRPGLLEPVGVHRDHRGLGYGKAITIAAAGALRDMGSSSAVVCTTKSNVGAVAAYLSAGFQRMGDVADLRSTQRDV